MDRRKGRYSNFWKGGVYTEERKRELRRNWQRKNKWKQENKGKVSFYEKRRRARKKMSDGKHTFGEWELLKRQYNNTCPSCHKTEPTIKLTEDHIIPLSKGGSDNIENIQPLCVSCNSKKYTKTIIFIH